MNPMTLIIAWSVHNAELYVQWAEIPRPYKIVTRPEQIRGVADGTRIIWLDHTTDHYPPGAVDMIDDMLDGRRSGLVYDGTDRFLTPAVPTRQQAWEWATAALRGDDTTAAMVREWATARETVLAQRGCPCRGAHYSGPDDTQCRWCPCHQTEETDHQITARAEIDRLARRGAAVSGVTEATIREAMDMVINQPRPARSTWEGNWTPGDPDRDDDLIRRPVLPERRVDPDDADYSANVHIPTYHMPPDPVGPAVAAVPPTPPPVPAPGHYAEPKGWGTVPRMPDEPTGDALKSSPRNDVAVFRALARPGERPVW